MNYFLALRPTRSVRDRLAAVAERLQAWNLSGRWVDPEDYHITVCFLGRLEDTEARTIPWSVNDVARSLCAPNLDLPGLGACAGKREPRVVYAAVGDPDAWCMDLHLDLQDALGERPKRHFHPHITLCRPRGGGEGNTWPALLGAHGRADWGSCDVGELISYRSLPAGGAERFQALERWRIPPAAERATA
jgi:2'-5' RNA ligase